MKADKATYTKLPQLSITITEATRKAHPPVAGHRLVRAIPIWIGTITTLTTCAVEHAEAGGTFLPSSHGTAGRVGVSDWQLPGIQDGTVGMVGIVPITIIGDMVSCLFILTTHGDGLAMVMVVSVGIIMALEALAIHIMVLEVGDSTPTIHMVGGGGILITVTMAMAWALPFMGMTIETL